MSKPYDLYALPDLSDIEKHQAQMPMYLPPVFGVAVVKIREVLPELLNRLDTLQAENLALVNGLQHYTKQQVGKILSFSPRQIDTWIQRGLLRPVCFDQESKKKDLRFTFAEIKRFSDHHRMEINEPAVVRGRAVTKR